VRHRDDPGPQVEWRVAKVLRRWHPTSKSSPEQQQNARFKREVVYLQTLHEQGGPNIVEVIDCDFAPTDDQPWYVMPCYALGPMCQRDPVSGEIISWAENYRGNLDRVIDIARSVADTLAFMHGQDPPITHRDVSTANVFLSNQGSPPVLGDFGLSRQDRAGGGPPLTGDQARLGPWRARPPELTGGNQIRNDPRSDVYMLGMLMFEALSGGDHLERPEFPRGTFKHELPAYSLSRFAPADPRLPHLDRLLRYMLADAVEDRIAAAQVAKALGIVTK
jgi:serine/threonine protein kinase